MSDELRQEWNENLDAGGWESLGQGFESEPQPRDPVIDIAKDKLRTFFAQESTGVFYQRQLQVIFEREFFHWITARAVSELAKEGDIAAEVQQLPGTGTIVLYRSKAHRYWKTQAATILRLVLQFSEPWFKAALGTHGELMFDAAVPRGGFLPGGRDVRSYGGRTWTETNHNLDRIFERDGIAYGTEIKNTLPYIEKSELEVKLRMCKFLRLRPLFIVRMAPANYIYDVTLAGGFTLIFKWQLYPLGWKAFADEVAGTLRLPVDCPGRIEDGTVRRLLDGHQKILSLGIV